MLISIVIATYNSGKTIKQCLDSIVSQDYTKVEVIVKDGASSDNTLDIISQYRDFLTIYIVTSKDNGVYDAWNQALLSCNGSWITFLGSDDYFVNEKSLSSVTPHLLKLNNKECHLVYGNNKIVDLDGKFIGELGEPWISAKQSIHQEMSIRHPGSFVTSKLISKVGGFDESFKIIGDYDFILSSLKFTDVSYYPFSIVNHRVGGLSISPTRSLDVIKENVKLRKKHKLSPYLHFDSLFFKRLILYVMSKFTNDDVILKVISRIK